MRTYPYIVTFVLLYFFSPVWAEEGILPPRWAVKTNLLYWATTTPNIGVEYAFSEKISLEVTAGYNPFYLGKREEDKKLQHWQVRPEVRWWYCEKYTGSVWGIHLFYGRFNTAGVELPGGIFPAFGAYRREGSLVGGGLSYGYQWLLAPRFSLEASLGIGYSYFTYDRYECGTCGKYKDRKEKAYFGPTKLAVSMVYLF